MAANLYFIKCITNLQVGSGDVNYNIIDKEVEKDPVTDYPTINASGVKGAFRQFFEKIAPELTARLFGSPVKTSQSKPDSSKPGSLSFLNASMLAKPVRATAGSSAYYMATTKCALDQFRDTVLAITGVKVIDVKGLQPNENCRFFDEACAVEGYSVTRQLDMTIANNKQANKYLKSCIGSKTVILSNDTFRNLSLPVLARNCLDNDNPNLWYEEYVPHESVFWFMVLGSEDDLSAFNEVINGKVVQFGGNASIGCGLCLVTLGGVQNVQEAN